MLSHIFHLRTNDVTVPSRDAWKIDYNSNKSTVNGT
jgi:hypothetical protein